MSYETTSNNAKFRTWPLLAAIANLPLMELLLASGADPNVQCNGAVTIYRTAGRH